MAKFAFIKILKNDFMPKKAQLLGVIEMENNNPYFVFPKIMMRNDLDIIEIIQFRYHKNGYKLTTPELWDIEIITNNKKLLSIALLAGI